MRREGIFLIASLALNVTLLAVRLHQSHPTEATSAAQPSDSAVKPIPTHVASFDPSIWASIDRESTDEMRHRLEAEGFPPEIVHALVWAHIRERHERVDVALRKKLSSRYWLSAPTDADYTGKDLEIRQKLKEERNRFVADSNRFHDEELFDSSEQSVEWRRFRYGDLPLEKVQRIEAINRDYDEIRNNLGEQMQGIAFPGDKERRAYLEKERWADLAKALSPEELENYELRSTPTAQSLRYQLAGFDPSEDEFKRIYHAQKAFEAKYDVSTLDSDQARELREAEMRSVLSPERFEDYKVKTSGSYPPVKALVSDLKLPESTIASVIHLQQDTVKQVLAIRSNPSLTSDERNAQLRRLSDAATSKLRETFGDEGFKQYKSSAGGWLKNLQTTAR